MASALTWATQALQGLPTPPEREARYLLAACLGCSLDRLFAAPSRYLEPVEQSRFESFVEARQRGEPLAYLTGHREFWSLDFRVSRHTLVPRPESEALVAHALSLIPEDQPGRLLDLGTGSGVLAIAIARERPRLEIWATDQSPEALEQARANARSLGTTSILFRGGDWFHALPQGLVFEWIVSNPPYLSEHDPALGSDGLRHEPRESLVAGPTGLEALTRIVDGAPSWLASPGWLILEHAPDQARTLAAYLADRGWQNVAPYRDIAGAPQGTSAAWRPRQTSA